MLRRWFESRIRYRVRLNRRSRSSSYTSPHFVVQPLARPLGGGSEGTIYAGVLTPASSSGKGKPIPVTIKVFKTNYSMRKMAKVSTKHSPQKQVDIMHGLIRLNRVKKLGLHLPSFVSLANPHGNTLPLWLYRFVTRLRGSQASWVVSGAVGNSLWDPYYVREYKVRNGRSFTGEYQDDMSRQIAILKKEGYFSPEFDDHFMPVFEEETGRAKAVLVDFGALDKRKE